MFRCPVCAGDLTVEPRRYHCEQGHSFDRAREGYVNLLAGRSARHRTAGDSDEMITARRAVLDAGLYAPLRDAVLSSISAGAVLDIGCGEGYYTRPLADRSEWIGGIDLSKVAIRAAARRTTSIAYAVANAFDLPVVTSSIDIAVIVFGPMVPEEIERVLRPDGALIVATPGPRHLIELKRVLFDDPVEHPLAPPASLAGWPPSAEIERVTFPMQLTRDQLTALWAMTPYRWQVDRSRLVVLPDAAEVTADFLVCRYRRR